MSTSLKKIHLQDQLFSTSITGLQLENYLSDPLNIASYKEIFNDDDFINSIKNIPNAILALVQSPTAYDIMLTNYSDIGTTLISQSKDAMEYIADDVTSFNLLFNTSTYQKVAYFGENYNFARKIANNSTNFNLLCTNLSYLDSTFTYSEYPINSSDISSTAFTNFVNNPVYFNYSLLSSRNLYDMTYDSNDRINIFNQGTVATTYGANIPSSSFDYKNITSISSSSFSGSTITCANHGYSNGDYVTIYNTGNYNGTYIIYNVTTNTFDINILFSISTTGSVVYSGYSDIRTNTLFIPNTNTANNPAKSGHLCSDGYTTKLYFPYQQTGLECYLKIYNIVNNSWSTSSSIGAFGNDNNSEALASCYLDGYMYVYLRGDVGEAKLFKKYNESNNTWTTLSEYPNSAYIGSSVTIVPNYDTHKISLITNYTAGSKYHGVYDPTTNSWDETTYNQNPGIGCSYGYCINNKLYMIKITSASTNAPILIYDFSTKTWSTAATTDTIILDNACCMLRLNRYIHITYTNTSHRYYDIQLNSWTTGLQPCPLAPSSSTLKGVQWNQSGSEAWNKTNVISMIYFYHYYSGSSPLKGCFQTYIPNQNVSKCTFGKNTSSISNILYPKTPSSWTNRKLYMLKSSTSITSVANGTGGKVTVTSANHGLVNGDTATITGTENYNGNYEISNITTDTFDIIATWVATDTGIVTANYTESNVTITGNTWNGEYGCNYYMWKS
jgi:hypothetical protein